jgi:hypothetical protein
VVVTIWAVQIQLLAVDFDAGQSGLMSNALVHESHGGLRVTNVVFGDCFITSTFAEKKWTESVPKVLLKNWRQNLRKKRMSCLTSKAIKKLQ